MSRQSRWITTCFVFLLAVPASAADDPAQLEKGKALVASLAALKKADDATGFQGELKAVVELHNGIEDSGMKGKLQKELGGALKSKKMSDAHVAILKALGELNDPKGAFKQFKKMLPTPKEEEAAEIQLEALRTVAVLAPEDALKQLLELGEKAKSRPAAIAAIEALGHYGQAKKRVMVLEELIKLVMRFMPPRGVQVGEETTKRWNDLAPPLINALNMLTGQKIGDPDEWLQLWRDNKKKPEALFQG